ncbi:MAG TPA: hypothetical protein VHV57_14775 [Acidimicrobiales bacterium]|jgi:hypothetical protein|nr:hypothetical protein [Acidimicrobiales bacterium]
MGHGQTGSPWVRLLCAASIIPALCVLIPAGSAGAATAHRLSSLHVVGGPVSAGKRAIVISVDSSRNLHLDGIDPVSGKVAWQRPYSAVGVTPGVPLYPDVIGTTVMDVAPPRGKPRSPLVGVSGINATTGATVWSDNASFVPSDSPSTCAANTYFCIPGYNANGSTSLVLLNAATGLEKTILNGPYREMGPDLYQTGANKPTLDQISPTATLAWKFPVSTLYGPEFDPDYGWIIYPSGTLNIGSIEAIVKGNGYNVSVEKTLGFSVATGAVQWTLPDEFLCGGGIGFLESWVACHYGGVLKDKSSSSLKKVTLTLEGFEPASGAVTWKLPVRDVQSLAYGEGVEFLDDTHLVVTAASGQPVLLNTDDGTTKPLSKGEVFWCQKNPNYKVTVPKGLGSESSRVSTSLYFGCTANGKPTTKVPAATPDNVGISLDGVFVWPTPDGLRSRAIGTPQSFT